MLEIFITISFIVGLMNGIYIVEKKDIHTINLYIAILGIVGTGFCIIIVINICFTLFIMNLFSKIPSGKQIIKW